MDIRTLSADYAVSPQIAPQDLAAIREAGFKTVVCNRPDSEIPSDVQAQAIRQATETAGLRFIENPVMPGRLTPEIVATQTAAIAETDGPVLAYCASGNRSAIVWSLVQVPEIGVDAVLEATRSAGYDHAMLRPQFEAMAATR